MIPEIGVLCLSGAFLACGDVPMAAEMLHFLTCFLGLFSQIESYFCHLFPESALLVGRPN